MRRESLEDYREVQPHGDSDSDCFTERGLSVSLKISIALLRKWRREGGGPPFVRLGRAVRYLKPGVQSWLQAREVRR